MDARRYAARQVGSGNLRVVPPCGLLVPPAVLRSSFVPPAVLRSFPSPLYTLARARDRGLNGLYDMYIGESPLVTPIPWPAGLGGGNGLV